MAEVVFLTKDDAQEAYRRYHRRNLDGEAVCTVVGACVLCGLTSVGLSYSAFLCASICFNSRPSPPLPSPLGQPMICKLLTDLRSSGFAMHSPPLTRYSGLSDLDAGWGYTGGF